MTLAMTHIAYFGTIALLFAIVPMGYLGDLQSMTKTLFIVGFLGMWRYGWALINFTRAFLYRFRVYPRRKAAYQRRFEELGAPSHMYVMITSYMVDPDVTLMVYRKLFAACANARDGATIVASVVDGADERLIRQIYDSSREDLRDTRLVIDRIKANGKRDAMMKALRILATFQPTQHDIMVFIDGDTAPPPDLWAQAAPVFSDPGVGALTTDEAALIDKPGLFRDWFDLRFHQRNVMMCSMGLSKRVLTLTGRLSVFRAALATDPGFIRGVGQDYLDHWRLGRIDFLTGDDKSTWFWLLTHGYQTVYLPDVQSESVETQPRPTFYDSARTLMIRWFGNMMRTNGRALRLPPGRIGYFTWWSILDQKVSMWTTLVGPLSVLFTAILHSAWVLPLYAGWVLLTRYTFCVVIALFNRCWFPVTHPPVLYFSQVFGAIIKTYVFFRLDRQKWTRQASSSGGGTASLFDRIKQLESVAHHAVALSFLALAILFLNTVEQGGLAMPDTLKVYRMEGPEGHLDTDLDTRLDMGFDPDRPLAEPEPPLSLDLPLGPDTAGPAEAAAVPKDFGLEKEHPLFPLPFSVYLDGVSWAGKSISVTQMIVTPEGSDRLMLGTRHMACVYLRYPNFGISLDAEVEVVEAGPDGEAALQFTDPMGDHLPQLRYLINSYIAGDVVSLNGMLSYTGPTKSKLPVPVPTRAEGRKERFKSISVLTLSAVIAMVAAVVVFTRYTTGHEMHPVFVDRAGQQLRATVGGQIGFVNPEAQQGDIVFSVNSNSGDVLNFQMPCDCEIAMQPGIAAGSTVLPADLVATVYQGDAALDVNTMISVSGLSRAMRGDHLWLDFPGGRSVEVQAVPSAATRAATMSGDVFLPVTLQPVEEASLSPEDTGTSARLRITPNLSDRFGIN